MAKLFHPVWVSTRAGNSGSPYIWGEPCLAAGEANRAGKAQIAGGNASLAFVVREEDGVREILYEYTSPESAKKIIKHLLAVEEQLET